MKRLLAGFTAIAVITACLPFGMAASAADPGNVIDSFDNINNVVVSNSEVMTLEHDAAVSESGTADGSLKISQLVEDTSASAERIINIGLQGDYYSKNVLDWSAFTGIRFWIRYDGTEQLKLRPKFNIREHARGNSNSPYYQVKENSITRDEKKFSSDGEGFIYIDAGFTGYIYIPFSSLKCWVGSVDTSKVHSMVLNIFSNTLKSDHLWIDGIGAYTASATPSYDFECGNGKSINNFFNTALPNPADTSGVTMSVTSEQRSPLSRKGLKFTGDGVTNASAFVELNRWYNNGSQLNVANYGGFSFWANNTNDAEVKIGFYKRYTGNVATGKPITLISDDGVVTEWQYSANRYFMLPANFKGYIYIPKSTLGETGQLNNNLAFELPSGGSSIANPLYIDEITMYTEIPTDAVQPYDISVADFQKLPVGNALVAYPKAATASLATDKLSISNTVVAPLNPTVKINVGSDVSGYSGLRFWVSTPAALNLKAAWGTGAMQENTAYSLGDEKKVVNANGQIEIPAGYEGYVSLPFNSFASAQKAAALYLTYSAADYGVNIFYLDTLSGYKLVRGDATGDEILNIKDFVRMKKYCAKVQDTVVNEMADLNADNTVDSLDLTLIYQLLLGISPAA